MLIQKREKISQMLQAKWALALANARQMKQTLAKIGGPNQKKNFNGEKTSLRVLDGQPADLVVTQEAEYDSIMLLQPSYLGTSS